MCSAAGSTRSTSSSRAGRTRGSSGTPRVDGQPVGDEQRLALAHRAGRAPVRLEVLPEPLDLLAAARTPTRSGPASGAPGRRTRPGSPRWSPTGTTFALAQHSDGQLAVDPVPQDARRATRCGPPRGPGRPRRPRAEGRVRTRRGRRRGRRATADGPGSACAARGQPRAPRTARGPASPTAFTGTGSPRAQRPAVAAPPAEPARGARGRQRRTSSAPPSRGRARAGQHERPSRPTAGRRPSRPARRVTTATGEADQATPRHAQPAPPSQEHGHADHPGRSSIPGPANSSEERQPAAAATTGCRPARGPTGRGRRAPPTTGAVTTIDQRARPGEARGTSARSRMKPRATTPQASPTSAPRPNAAQRRAHHQTTGRQASRGPAAPVSWSVSSAWMTTERVARQRDEGHGCRRRGRPRRRR